MYCPNCRANNPEGSKFCSECGQILRRTSKAAPQGFSLNEKIENIQRYLPQGLADKILNQKDKIEGERKQVTVMFCDIEGFVALVDRIGSEEAYGIMDRVYEILIHCVNDHEGTVNEMTGDGIMALFGAPIALEDAPQKALWSALSVHRGLARFNEEKKGTGPIRMRIGIHTGPVVVGTLGNDLRVDFKAVGKTVNLAARMEELAQAGSIYVTEDTFRLTKQLFRFKAVGKKSVKGKKESILVYEVLAAKEDVHRPRLGSERRIYSEMVGRDKELNRLELQVMKVINGEGSVVNIIGEAGTGKSRLVAELKKRDVIKRVNFLEGRAISMGRNLSFHPIIDILKQWARIREDDGEAMAFGKLESAVKRLCPQDFSEVLPFVATLMGMNPFGRYAERIKGIEGEPLEKLILKNLRELLIKASALTPLVIVAEDMHWVDTSSIELLESLFRLAETHKILFVNVFRPGHKATGDRLVETIKNKLPVYYVEIAIEPLNDSMSEILINNMLHTSINHHAVIEKIIQRAGGNPFFIEEVVRSLIDRHVITLKDGKFELTEKIARFAIPNSISDVLMARVDHLEEDTRNLVKVAAVIGRTFFYKVLSKVVGPDHDIDARLSHLKEIQLVRQRTRMGEVEYLFKHALAQEAIYDSILPQKQKELHLKVAGAIEKVFSERLHEFYGMLAYHYSKAENLDKTEKYLIKAGEEALKSSASNEALHYYQQALRLYLATCGDASDPAKVAMLEKNIALALYNRGTYDEAIEYFVRVLSQCWGELPRHSVSSAIQLSASFFHFLLAVYLPSLKFRRSPTPQDAEAIHLFYKKCKALAVKNPKRWFVESFYFLKRITIFDLTKVENGPSMFATSSALFFYTGISFKLSRRILDYVKGMVREDDVRDFIIYDLLETLHHYLAGDWKAIKAYDDQLVNRSLSLGEIYDASLHLFWHGLPTIFRGYFDITESIIGRMGAIAEVYENDFLILVKYDLNKTLLLECRKLDEALIEIDKAIAFSQKAGFNSPLQELYSSKAFINLMMGDIEGVERDLKLADKIRLELNLVPVQLSSFYRSQVEYDLYRFEESQKHGDTPISSHRRKQAAKSLKILLKTTLKVAQYRTESYKLKGVYYWLINKQKKALKWWHKAIKEGEHLGARLELSRTYVEIGKRLLEPKSDHKIFNGIKAEKYLEMAAAFFEEMNLEWDLKELDRAPLGDRM